MRQEDGDYTGMSAPAGLLQRRETLISVTLVHINFWGFLQLFPHFNFVAALGRLVELVPRHFNFQKS